MRTTLIFGAALLGAAAVFASCSSDDSSDPGADAGLHGPTDLVVTWTFKGVTASADVCQMYMADTVNLSLDATIDTSLEQTKTGLRCADGKVTFPGLLVENLGNAQIEGDALDAMEMSVASNYVVIQTLMLGTTTVNIDFFGPDGAAVSSTADVSGASTVATTSASTGGNGGAGGTGGSGNGGSGGKGGAASTTASSSTASSTASSSTASSTASSSTASSTASSSTAASTGAGGGDGG